jgi:hypothetical protein
MPEQHLYLNGINGVTGNYLVPPLRPADAAAFARGEPPPSKEVADWLKRMRAVVRRPFLALPFDVDPTNVSKAGWAVVFARDTPAEVRAALAPLIAHRRKRVPPDRCKELDYQPGEGMKDWLTRHGVYPGNVAPTRVPYYVLLVGDPSAIPFEFQYLLDVEYAVGRLAFDEAKLYGQYAQSVVDYETAAAVPNQKEITYWGTRHGDNDATQMSADWLLTPLFQGLGPAPEEQAVASVVAYRSRCFKANDATKANLLELLHARGAAPRPAMLFTASHGLGWPVEDQRLYTAQGALLCQDWSGFGTMLPEHYLAAGDVADDARLHGLVAFLFACFGAGTPQQDNFLFDRHQPAPVIADRPFIAPLPQRLLSHPQGGALAVIGHVERAWGYSIRPLDDNFQPLANVGPQLVPFRNCVGRILAGEPVGHATKDISEKYAILSTDLLALKDETQPGPKPSDEKLVWVWVERNDAQNYILLGDPAVRIRVDLLS